MSTATKYLLVVGGPTASGKTTLAIALAKHFNTEIISGDSRQFYREMSIGTARPTKEELDQVKHHFVADRTVEEPLSAGQFATEALVMLTKLFAENDHVVLVGGSGLFIKALCEGLDSFPPVSQSTRTKADQLLQKGGLEALQEALKIHDPAYYEVADQQNPVRLQRALEVCWSGSHPYSYYLGKKNEERPFVPIYFQPSWPRKILYERIEKRVDQMVEAGLEAEAQTLEAHQSLATLQTVGYQEWFAHLAGTIDRETAIALIKQNTRRYAKRQLTWNRRDGHWKSVLNADLRSALTYLQLVQNQNLSLVNISQLTEKTLLSDKERKLGVGMVNTSGEIAGSVTFLTLKDWGWITSYTLDGLDHLATMVLLHEALQRTEIPVVYAQPTDDKISFFEQLGFILIGRSKIPDKLLPKLAEEHSIWMWERAEQLF